MMEKEQKTELLKLIISAVLFAAALIFEHLVHTHAAVYIVLYLLSYAVAGYEVVFKAIKNIIKLNPLDETFLMTAASVGAIFTGSFAEASGIMILYGFGEFLQDLAVDKSRDAIKALMDITPDSATVLRGGEMVELEPGNIVPGDRVVIKNGRRVPVDGTVVSGSSLIDASAVTGESVPVSVSVGDRLMSGTVNVGSEIVMTADTAYENSTAAKMAKLAEEAEKKKAHTEDFITRFAKIYTPAVVIAAVLIAVIPPIFGGAWSEWIHRALVLLVVSCPCALVISVPLTFFAGIGAASKRGILVKGGEYFETVSRAGIFAFDKTGTLTEGRLTVSDVKAVNDRDLLIKIARSAESHSDHPIAKAICALDGDTVTAEEVTETAGEGIECKIEGKKAFVGGSRLMKKQGVNVENVSGAVHVLYGGEYLGFIVTSDKVKKHAAKSLQKLKETGIKRTVMLSGDGKAAAERAAAEAGIDEVHAELLPADKVAEMEKLLSEGKTVYAGDGINDAAVLARADTGIAMGGIGSDAAIEAADIVITDDDIRKLPELCRISKKTVGIAKQNIIFALVIKAVILLLSVFGVTGMWLAVFADTGVALLAAANAMRASK